VFANWNPSSISTGVFNDTWAGCTSLTAQSVENILVSIAASGQFATVDGNSGSAAIADAGIDIDYNGDPLSAATTAAIDSLSGKGWQVYINGEQIIPNILTLEPAAAYSLRSFDADADPNVVNVRRSSDGATSDFTASEVSDGTLVAWVGAGNDGHVTTWYDQSGTNHANQSTASRQPKIVDAGTLVTVGGLAALDFDGAFDYLFNDSVASSFTGNDIPISIFTCFKETASSYSDIVSLSNGALNNPLKRLFRINGYSRYDQRDDAATFISPIGDFGLTNQILNSVTSTGNSVNLYEQGVLKASDTTDFGNVTLNRFSIGALRRSTVDAPMNGQIQEIVVFDTDQSSNRTGIENNINDHFDIYS